VAARKMKNTARNTIAPFMLSFPLWLSMKGLGFKNVMDVGKGLMCVSAILVVGEWSWPSLVLSGLSEH